MIINLPKQGFCTNENFNILYFDKFPGFKTAYYVFTNGLLFFALQVSVYPTLNAGFDYLFLFHGHR